MTITKTNNKTFAIEEARALIKTLIDNYEITEFHNAIIEFWDNQNSMLGNIFVTNKFILENKFRNEQIAGEWAPRKVKKIKIY